MIINYKLAMFVYSPVLILLIVSLFKDRFEPRNKTFKLCNWSLLPAILILFTLLTEEEVKSLWYANLIPILRKYPYNPASLEIFNSLFYCLLLMIVYALLRNVYNIRILDAFDLKLARIPLVLKICGILMVLNIFSITLLDTNLLINRPSSEFIKSMERQHLVFLFSTIVLAPVVEETIFRGLLYAPLYRKVGRSFSIILSSIFWSQAHFQPLLTSVGLFIIGLILGWLYDKSGSLLIPITLHSFKNSWIIIYFI